jgi:hypothetical protein
MKNQENKNKMGSTPVFVMSIISFLVATTSGLTVFIYKTNADDVKQNIKTIQDINSVQDKDISSIKQSVEYLVKGQDQTNKDIKEILKILK